MAFDRTRLLVLGLLTGLVSTSALAGPICQTTQLIAFPSKLAGASPENVANLDKDQDGLLDQAEEDLAACVVPELHFDSGEPALQANEPHFLFTVFPDGLTPAGHLRVHVIFTELFRKDGGFIYCNWPEANGCNSHDCDSQGFDIALDVTGLKTAEISQPIVDPVNNVFPSYNGTHQRIYESWGKHHHYTTPYVCPNGGDFNSCDCGHDNGCGLGHWDRANGNGVVRLPTVIGRNVGQAESFDFSSRPQLTPRGFVNRLDFLDPAFASEYVYDLDAWGPPIEWKDFLDDSACTPVHDYAVHPATRPDLFLRQEAGKCVYSSTPVSAADDPDGDGIPTACDPCGKGRRGFPLGVDSVRGVTSNGGALTFVDSDGDGRLNGCDLCPGKNDRGLGNGNEDGEADRNVPGAGDACDPHAVSSLRSVYTPTTYELFEDSPPNVSMRNAQTIPGKENDVLGGELVSRRCFCVDALGQKVTDPTLCNNDQGAFGQACARNGVASQSYATGIGWLPFRSRRLAAPSGDVCQPLAAGPNGEAEELCSRQVQVSYPTSYSPSPGPVSELDWQRQPTLAWDIWEETEEKLSEELQGAAPRVPAIPQAVRVARQLLPWETSAPSWSSSTGDVVSEKDASYANLLCKLDPTCYVPKCSCYGVDCLQLTNPYYIGGRSCILDALPYHVDGDVAFWTRVTPQTVVSPDTGSSYWAHLHDSFAPTQHIVTTDRRGYTTQGKKIPQYAPDRFWWLHPEEIVSVDPVDGLLGGPATLFASSDGYMTRTATWDWEHGYAQRFGDVTSVARGLAIAAWAPSGASLDARRMVMLPEWTVWEGTTGRLLRLGSDGVARNAAGGPAGGSPEEQPGPDQYEIKTEVQTDVLGTAGKLARLGAEGFLLAARQQDATWAFFRLDRTGASTRVELPAHWVDAPRLVSVQAGQVAVLGRVAPWYEEASGPLLALVDPSGSARTVIDASLPIRYGGWAGRGQGGASLLVGGGLGVLGEPHGDVVEVRLPALEVVPLVADGAVDGAALGSGAWLSGRQTAAGLEVLAATRAVSGQSTPPLRRLDGGQWQPAGLAASDSLRTDVTSQDRNRYAQLCAASTAAWWVAPGKLAWSASPTTAPLTCAAAAGPSAPRATTLDQVTAHAALEEQLWVARAGYAERWQPSRGLLVRAESVAVGAGVTAMAAAPEALALAKGSVIEVWRRSDGVWARIGSTTSCEAVRSLSWDGDTLWAVGDRRVAPARVGQREVRWLPGFAMGTDSHGEVRLLPAGAGCGRSTETLVASSMAGQVLVLGTGARLMIYDLRRSPELALLGTLALSSTQPLSALRTDGAWLYARTTDAATGAATDRSWRIGPQAAFVDVGATSARWWLGGVHYGPHVAARRNGAYLEVETW